MDLRTSLTLLLISTQLMTCVPILVPAQNDTEMKAILLLSGASGEEELDEQEVERYSSLLANPLEINLSPKSRLLSSGLLTQYQAASLFDYRLRNGDILSVSELAVVDGFGEETASVLAPFISFRSRALPGHPVSDSLRVSNDLTIRGAMKNGDWNYGIKYKLALEDRAELSLAARTTYSDKGSLLPTTYSFNLLFYGRKHLGKLILGDFNARFGQGLTLWSGFAMSGFSNSSSFYKRPSGLSASWSYSGIGSHRGVAADFLFGKMVLSSFLSFPGLRNWCENGKTPEISILPGMNLAWYGRSGQLSLTAFAGTAAFAEIMMGNWGAAADGGNKLHSDGNGLFRAAKVSVDFRYSFRGVDFFGEASRDFLGSVQAAAAGSVVPLPAETKLSLLLRLYPEEFPSEYASGTGAWTKTSNEYGIALGLERRGCILTADFARKADDVSERQCKLLLKIPVQLTEKAVLSVRATERIRPYETLVYRTGARCDIDFSSSGISAIYGPEEGESWKLRYRIEGLLCRSLGLLSYIEAGRKSDRFAACLRCTVFRVDNWEDRIYSYERDAPGNFTVPAYYGRGYSLSAVANGKFLLWKKSFKAVKLYFRASTVRYPLMKAPKPSSFEVKLQAVFDL